MIIAMILVGGAVGALSALLALILGQSLWMALLIYSAAGVASVLVGAVALALRPTPRERADPELMPVGPQRG
jgi:hypothetical protein